jgi:hypothetical protein
MEEHNMVDERSERARRRDERERQVIGGLAAFTRSPTGERIAAVLRMIGARSGGIQADRPGAVAQPLGRRSAG